MPSSGGRRVDQEACATAATQAWGPAGPPAARLAVSCGGCCRAAARTQADPCPATARLVLIRGELARISQPIPGSLQACLGQLQSGKRL